MNISDKISQAVRNRYSAQQAMQRYYEENDFNPYFMLEIISAFEDPTTFPKEKLNGFSIPIIIDYLEKTHHYYLNKRLPEIAQSIGHLFEGENQNMILLKVLSDIFYTFKKNLQAHFKEEEAKLFPYAQFLHAIAERKHENPFRQLHLHQYYIEDSKTAHEAVEYQLKAIQGTIDAFDPDFCNQSNYRILQAQIKNFEIDLYIHEQIEDTILLPKIKALKKEFRYIYN